MNEEVDGKEITKWRKCRKRSVLNNRKVKEGVVGSTCPRTHGVDELIGG